MIGVRGPLLLTVAVLGTASAGCHDLSLIHRPDTDGGSGMTPDEGVCTGVMCSGACVLDTDSNPATCGSACQPCSAPANAHATCAAGQCGFVCDDEYFAQGNGCVPVPPSCHSLAASCGPTHDDNCCASDDVMGGQFSRGYDHSDQTTQDGMPVVGWQDLNAAPAFIADFSLDRYEVTIGRFRPFLADYDEWRMNNPDAGAGGYPQNPAGGWLRAWNTRTDLYAASASDFRNLVVTRGCPQKILDWLDDPTGANDQKPMSCVSWHEAFMFCIWDGARLPTEGEWHYAASGGEQQRAYPWGTPASLAITTEANVGKGSGDHFVVDVGSLPDGKSRWGQFDLAGNVSEIVYDTVDDPSVYDKTMVSNPLVTTLTDRLIRGGSYKYGAVNARSVYRFSMGNGVMFRYADTGWRCARPAAITAH